MATLHHSLGPAAAEAFTFGIATATTAVLAGIWVLLWAGLSTFFGAIARRKLKY